MNFLTKNVLYDWYGYNQKIFMFINHLYASATYDSLMRFLSNTFDDEHFPHILAALLLYVVVTALARKVRGEAVRDYLHRWIAVFAVLGVGFLSMGIVIKTMKSEFSYPRPYVVYAKDEVRKLEELPEKSNNRSFPSGHAAFVSFLLVALAPVLSADMGLIAWIIGLGVCWSRMAVGSHFPMDVLTGFIVAGIIVSVVQRIVYGLLRELLAIRC